MSAAELASVQIVGENHGMDMIAAFGSLTSAMEIAKGLRATSRAFDQAELKGKIIDLTDALLEARMQFGSIQDEVAQKDREIRQLKEQLARKEEMHYEAPYWWVLKGETKEGPYCPVCWEKEQKQVHLRTNYGEVSYCLVCRNSIA